MYPSVFSSAGGYGEFMSGRIGPVKLQSVAGAYWRGDSEREQLTAGSEQLSEWERSRAAMRASHHAVISCSGHALLRVLSRTCSGKSSAAMRR